MGLDMYLHRKINGEEIELVAYWRKANQIHKWFDDHIEGGVENVTEYPVTKELIQELLETTKDALYAFERGKDPSKYLPTQSGFFFGSTDYDEWYKQDLESTIEQLTKVLEEWDSEKVYSYYVWW